MKKFQDVVLQNLVLTEETLKTQEFVSTITAAILQELVATVDSFKSVKDFRNKKFPNLSVLHLSIDESWFSKILPDNLLNNSLVQRLLKKPFLTAVFWEDTTARSTIIGHHPEHKNKDIRGLYREDSRDIVIGGYRSTLPEGIKKAIDQEIAKPGSSLFANMIPKSAMDLIEQKEKKAKIYLVALKDINKKTLTHNQKSIRPTIAHEVRHAMDFASDQKKAYHNDKDANTSYKNKKMEQLAFFSEFREILLNELPKNAMSYAKFKNWAIETIEKAGVHYRERMNALLVAQLEQFIQSIYKEIKNPETFMAENFQKFTSFQVMVNPSYDPNKKKRPYDVTYIYFNEHKNGSLSLNLKSAIKVLAQLGFPRLSVRFFAVWNKDLERGLLLVWESMVNHDLMIDEIERANLNPWKNINLKSLYDRVYKTSGEKEPVVVLPGVFNIESNELITTVRKKLLYDTFGEPRDDQALGNKIFSKKDYQSF